LDGFRWVLSFDETPVIPDTKTDTKTHIKTYDYFAVVDNNTNAIVKVFPNQKDVAEYLGISPALANKKVKEQTQIAGRRIIAWETLSSEARELYLQNGNVLPIKQSSQSKGIIRSDPITKEETMYPSVVNVTDTMKVSRRDVLNAIKNSIKFKGFTWRWA
jgi:hypothetical protein